MSDKSKPTRIIDSMFDNDAFSQWLGIERLEEKEGSCVLKMKIREEMTNGFKIAHGGVLFSFADSALAFASNSLGRQAVSIETSISNMVSVQIGENLIAKARQLSITHKIGVYQVDIFNEEDLMVASFKGTVYRSSKEWKV